MCRPLVLGCQKGLSGLFCWGSRVAEVAQRAAFALRGAGRADGTAVQHHPVAEIVRFLRRQTPAQLLLNLHGVLAAVRNAEPPRDADTVRVADIALLPVDVAEDEVGGFSSDTRQAEKIVHVVRHATAKAREQLLRAGDEEGASLKPNRTIPRDGGTAIIRGSFLVVAVDRNGKLTDLPRWAAESAKARFADPSTGPFMASAELMRETRTALGEQVERAGRTPSDIASLASQLAAKPGEGGGPGGNRI